MKKHGELLQGVQNRCPGVRFISLVLALSMFTIICPTATFAVENQTVEAILNVEIEAKTTDKTAELILAKAGLDGIISKKPNHFIVNSSIANISFNNDAITAIANIATNNIKISASIVGKKDITSVQKAIIGNAPMYDFSITNGNDKLSNFGSGSATISIPYALKDGEDGKFIAVWYFDIIGKLIPIDATYADGYVNFTVDHFANYIIGYLPFVDVEKGWYYESAVYAYNNNIFSGIGYEQFAPSTPMTRAMLISTLYKMNGNTEATVGKTWYSNALDWAIEKGITDGKNPEQKVNRAELVTILYRYANSIDKGPVGSWAIRLTYADTRTIPEWAISGAMFAQMKSILTGQPGNLFDATGLSTRAEVAAVLQRFSKIL